MRRTTRWELAIKHFVLEGSDAETPDKTHVTVCGGLASSITTLDIEAAAVPGTMIVALLTVLTLPLWTVGRCPFCCQISLAYRQKSSQPQHGAPASQCLRNVLSYLRQHGGFTTVGPVVSLRRSAEQLERLGHPKDVADLLLQIAVEVPMDRNLCDKIERGEVHDIEHDPR